MGSRRSQSSHRSSIGPRASARPRVNSSPAASPPVDGERLRKREYLGYALGDTASNFFFQTFNIFLTYYYVDVWGIPATALLWMMPIVRLIGAFDDPIMGLIADRTETRWGKFRPYLLWGAIPYGICGYLMFAGPDLGATGKLVYAYVTYALMLTSYTVINVPYSSLLGVISPSSRTRTVASSFRFVGAFAGALLISLFVRPLVGRLGAGNEMHGFRMTMAIFAVASVIMFWITFASTRERVRPPPGQKTNVREELRELFRNWPWVMLLITSVLSTTFVSLRSGSTLFYFKYVVGDDGRSIFYGLDRSTVFLTTGSLGLVLGTAGLGPIARKIDKKHYAAALSAITGVCFAAFFFVPKDSFGLQLGLNALAQFCAGPTSALTWALYGDVADYGEWKFGRRSTGLVYSASLFSIKTGIVVGGFLLPLALDQFGFVRNAVQTPRALLGITLAFSIAPAVFALLKAVALVIYPLNQRRVDEIEQALAARRAAHPAPANAPA
jgi:GPH family glycoside/pentoside/hexuronide:cation symporter